MNTLRACAMRQAYLVITVDLEEGIPWHQISILGHNFGMTKSITDIPKYVHMAMTQDMKVDKLVTNKFKSEDINDVVEKMHARQVHARWICAFD